MSFYEIDPGSNTYLFIFVTPD